MISHKSAAPPGGGTGGFYRFNIPIISTISMADILTLWDDLVASNYCAYTSKSATCYVWSCIWFMVNYIHVGCYVWKIVASELKDPIWHSSEWQIGSFSSEATKYLWHMYLLTKFDLLKTGLFLKSRGITPLTSELFNKNFHPLEVATRWRDPQLQVNENYSDLTKNRGKLFSNRADWCHIMALTCLKGGTECGNNKKKLIYSGPTLNPFKPDFTLSSSFTTSRESLSQFSTCSEWRGFDVGEKVKKIAMYLQTSFMGKFILNP